MHRGVKNQARVVNIDIYVLCQSKLTTLFQVRSESQLISLKKHALGASSASLEISLKC